MDNLNRREQVELPVERVNRLAWELARALNDYNEGYSTAVVLPSKTVDFAVYLAMGRDYQMVQKATYAYRDALVASSAEPDSADAQAAVEAALQNLKTTMLTLDRVSMPAQHNDPLLLSINGYREGLRMFNESAFPDSESDAMIEKTYGPPMRILADWETGAITQGRRRSD